MFSEDRISVSFGLSTVTNEFPQMHFDCSVEGNRRQVELYPRRRSTEYTHRPIPGDEYQSRRAEHPQSLDALAATNIRSGPDATKQTLHAAASKHTVAQLNTLTQSAQPDVSAVCHEHPIVPATSSDTRFSRNSYFS